MNYPYIPGSYPLGYPPMGVPGGVVLNTGGYVDPLTGVYVTTPGMMTPGMYPPPPMMGMPPTMGGYVDPYTGVIMNPPGVYYP